jgi:hypothetical protein
MDIIQKSVFGDNILHYFVPETFVRKFDDDLKKELNEALRALNPQRIRIRFEHGGETQEFAELVANFLIGEGFNLEQVLPVMMSEIPRNEFSIKPHEADNALIVIRIGSLM